MRPADTMVLRAWDACGFGNGFDAMGAAVKRIPPVSLRSRVGMTGVRGWDGLACGHFAAVVPQWLKPRHLYCLIGTT
jgi:hypothetical protein